MMEIKFETSGAAFEDYGDYEVSRILERISKEVEEGRTEGKVIDVYGNIIGEWYLD